MATNFTPEVEFIRIDNDLTDFIKPKGSLVLAEELREIKRTLLATALPSNSDGQRKNRIMVTSINPSEGKTFCSLNLARSLSLEKDNHVLLVDANIKNSSLSNRLKPTSNDIEKPLGLIDYLNDPEIEVSNLIYKLKDEELRFIFSGKNLDITNELLSGRDMQSLLTEFRERYKDRLVIFDAPPLMGVNESLSLADNVDQIIIVVENGRVKTKDLIKVKKKLPKNVIVHFVLNKSLEKNQWK